MISLGFHGGTGTVTGSKFLLACGEARLLVDCGMFQGLKALRLKNWDSQPFDARGVGWVVLTHAHIDHCGWLPRLVKAGFKGPVLCTPATAELVPIMLMDAAKLQEEDAEHFNRVGASKHAPALPLFDQGDVQRAVKLLAPAAYGEARELGGGLRVRLLDSGHILGSAMAEVAAREDGRTVSVLFSGDIGRYDIPLPPDPLPALECDYLVVESTYGNRLHGDSDVHSEVENAVKLAVASGGVLLIPAFAVGRTQQMLFILKELLNAGRIPRLPVHVDSPMALEATKIYLSHMAMRDSGLDAVKGGGSIVGDNVKLVRTQNESRRLADLKGPAVIVSASGMLAGGRVLHHVRTFLPRKSTVLAMAGYQAEGTRGRLLLEGRATLKVFGQEVPVRGRVLELPGFSGHADADELMRWLSGVKTPPKTVFVVHGESAASGAFAARLRAERGWNAALPALHEEVTL